MTFPNSLNKITPAKSKDGRVAIVMRTKNRPILLCRAFASVLSQKYENWQLYLVNDGGNPGDLKKLIKLNENAFRGRITVIHHETSRGMEAASNSALKQSEGEFLIVHDDDDSWHPEFLEKTAGFLNDPQNDAFAAVVTSAYIVHEKIMGDSVVELDREEFRPWGSEIDFSSMLVRNLYPPISMLMRKSVVNSVGEFNHQLPVLGDWDFNIRLLMMGDIGTIHEGLAYWHLRKKEEDDIYANSVHSTSQSHEKYDVFYRNSILRDTLNKNPELLGVVQTLSRHLNNTENAVTASLNRRIDLLEAQVVDVKTALQRIEASAVDTQLLLHKVLKPARRAWGMMRPFRKTTAKPSKRF